MSLVAMVVPPTRANKVPNPVAAVAPAPLATALDIVAETVATDPAALDAALTAMLCITCILFGNKAWEVVSRAY